MHITQTALLCIINTGKVVTDPSILLGDHPSFVAEMDCILTTVRLRYR